MQIVTTAELIGLRYGGRVSVVAGRFMPSHVLFCHYLNGVYHRTVFANDRPGASLIRGSDSLIFGGITAMYTMLGGLMDRCAVAVVQFYHYDGRQHSLPVHGSSRNTGDGRFILERVQAIRPEALTLSPVTSRIPLGSILMFMLLGFFFADRRPQAKA
jgi:hypothetical protein